MSTENTDQRGGVTQYACVIGRSENSQNTRELDLNDLFALVNDIDLEYNPFTFSLSENGTNAEKVFITYVFRHLE